MVIYVCLGILCLTTFVVSTDPNDLMCYNAKTCIHNSNEKCGVTKNGDVRRFFDSCDMLEYNCLKVTEYVATTADKCDSLPPLEDPKDAKEVK